MAKCVLDRIAKRRLTRLIVLVVLTACVVRGIISVQDKVYYTQKETLHIVFDRNQKEYSYDRNSPLIFVGGVPRSGTTLMRALLDAHPDVRCGEETRVIPDMMRSRAKWMNNQRERDRLLEAGIDDEVMNDAVAAFVLEVMAKHGEPAKRLCNKDPFTLSSLSYLHSVFPNGKYLLMIRDGRATVHSIISRHVGITGYNITSYRDCLTKWNRSIEKMYIQCLEEGPHVCLPVHYEQLVLHSEQWMRTILNFLDIPWSDAVLHHEDAVGKPGGISLSKKERSTDQVIKPINKGALTKWVGHIPVDVLADIDTIAPMLYRLGYDPHAKYPNYEEGRRGMDPTDRGKKEFRMGDKTNLQALQFGKVNHPMEGVVEAQLAYK
ncbi:protein-tyrosine sulfotransferase 1-like [Acanthaster planci]|uniref:Protein-tyrosine sulfotransferase n=1 Tax=Acanthaster planci TaxID=133434 RepID=A0A8B7XZW8_ACAPL|nr:protein-tyrosine sulfotransferase 1-like [Acanthaster planci]XP_022086449.1 protein-tyrosine sulfotransferase 1-like [Acanthaster planci]